MTRYFLGVDIGTTKSHALIADENGQAVGFGKAGTGNYEVVGWDGLQDALHTSTNQALASARITKTQIAGAGFGVAGYDWPEDREPTRKIIETLGLKAPFDLVNDAIIGLLAGTTAGWGVVVVAGTGNNCRGRDPQGREGRITGQGSRFAEYGGASELVAKAIQAVALAWTQRGPATRLSEVFIEQTGATDMIDLLGGLTRERYNLGAKHAPLVFEVAASGDQVAEEIIRWAGQELGSLTIGVIRQLGFEDSAFEVVLAGSLYKGSTALVQAMQETIHTVAPKAKLVRLQAPPVIGGVLLGMKQVNIDPVPVHQTLIDSTNELLQKPLSS
jgi:N-acetylglucosamine kinase-like BadF-type ATPase